MEVCVNLRDCLLAVEIQCVSLLWEVTLWWRTMRPCVHVVYVTMCHPRDGGLQRSSVCHSNRDIEVTNSYIIVDFQIQICSFSSPRIFSSLPAITRLHLDIQLFCDLWFGDLWQCSAMVTENLENFDNNFATFPTQWYRVYNCKELDKMSLPSCWRVWSHREADWWVPVIESNQSNRSNELFCNYHLTRPINGRWFWRW